MELNLNGKHLIGSQCTAAGSEVFQALNASSHEILQPDFYEATGDEVAAALKLADQAFEDWVESPFEKRAALLRSVADELEREGETILARCQQETALSPIRLKGELARTIYQTRLVAQMLDDGSWLVPRLDVAEPDRLPVAKPDIRSTVIGLGPVVVFGASNFPLAISVVGTDTITALAAGCPVVVKAHPAHPGTCELLGRLLKRVIQENDLPPGLFSLLQGRQHRVGQQLVEHPLTAAVAFTGSLTGGRALMDLAAKRKCPIPVYAEMGSVNPVFVFPSVVKFKAAEFAESFIQSLTLGGGQFCTNPGLVLIHKSANIENLLRLIRARVHDCAPACLLHQGIQQSYLQGISERNELQGAEVIQSGVAAGPVTVPTQILVLEYSDFERNSGLGEEVFGPCSVIVLCDRTEQMERFAATMPGQLTATIHASEEEVQSERRLLSLLRRRSGRLVYCGFPTGVEVTHAMHHGGPFPAASDAHYTSIGPTAISRFVRPVCYQGFPHSVLPPELQDGNPLGLKRRENGALE